MLSCLTLLATNHNSLALPCNLFYFCSVIVTKQQINKPYKSNVMKFLLVAITVVLSLTNTKAQATDDIKVSAAVLSSFNSAFKNVSEVVWKTAGNYYKADFSFNNQYVQSYYNADATLIAVTRNITSFQLPVTLQASLKKSYEAYWISDLFELSDDNGTAYYVTIENGDSKITLKSITANEWSVYKKGRKS